jgi:predicted short-subunit dehydrogenase-like oxidoreductase (DUF2520 family)
MSVIGGGRLGTALALALAKNGYETKAIVCRHIKSAKRAVARIGSGIPLTPDRLTELPQSELILITTPDDTIAETAESLAAVPNLPKNVCVLHTSGALSSTILSPLQKRGAQTGSLHPLVSVSDPEDGLQNLLGAFYCIEGQPKAITVAKRIVKSLGGQSFSIPSDKKPLYHAAAVMSSGHAVALFDIASEMLSHCGLKLEDAQQVLLPLIRSTVANLERSTPSEALTGTYSRGDVATVKQHLRVIEDEGLKDALKVYRLLGRQSLKLSSTVSKNPELLRTLKRLLHNDD